MPLVNDPTELVEATWIGPFPADLPDGNRLAIGDTTLIPAGVAIESGHWETDAELPTLVELPAANVIVTEEQLNALSLDDLREIVEDRDLEVEGTGANGRVLKGDLVAAIIDAQNAQGV